MSHSRSLFLPTLFYNFLLRKSFKKLFNKTNVKFLKISLNLKSMQLNKNGVSGCNIRITAFTKGIFVYTQYINKKFFFQFLSLCQFWISDKPRPILTVSLNRSDDIRSLEIHQMQRSRFYQIPIIDKGKQGLQQHCSEQAIAYQHYSEICYVPAPITQATFCRLALPSSITQGCCYTEGNTEGLSQ